MSIRVYDKKMPLIAEFLVLMIALIICLFLTGCRATAIHSIIHPLYEAKTNELAARPVAPTPEEITEAYKGIPKWLEKEKMSLSGVGENIADFEKKKISKQSSWKIPFSGASLKDVPSSNVR